MIRFRSRLAGLCLAFSVALPYNPCVAGNGLISPDGTGDEKRAGNPPNVVYIMADELGYFEPSFMGNANIQTPQLDRMASEGMRFTQGLAGSAVCAPTRCCFLTGKHSGHTSVRSNGGGTPLRADEPTIASILKPLGYATGGYGKWGCGGRGSTGVPEIHGFDEFLGYYDQVHAHSYYPPYIIRNSEELPLANNRGNSDGETYSHYVIMERAMEFIRENKDRPFFAYLPVTPPHGIFDIPNRDPAWEVYKDKPWPEQARRYAAMVTMLDRQLGEVLSLLKELQLEQNTLVIFSGDNGGADYFSSKDFPRGIHGANKHPETGDEFRGRKGQLYEGGLRIPVIARWPGKIKPGTISDHLWYFPDVLPTIAEVTGAVAPADIDGISFLPTLIGETNAGRAQEQHEYLYWEIGGQTAVRMKDWKAIQPKPNASWELYDLATDISESKDLSAAKPDVLAQMIQFAERAHQPVVEGTFESTEMHQRDRQAKFGNRSGGPAQKAKKNSATNKSLAMPEGMIAGDGFKVVRFSSENAGNAKYAANAIDGDSTTIWHTKFSGGFVPPPHELVIDLGAEYEIQGFVYVARQDSGWNGAIKDAELFISDSPDAWQTPVATTTFAKVKQTQTIECVPTTGRYVRLRSLSAHTQPEFASAAEFGVLGKRVTKP
jgi:arylsulfatase A-like enzyme